jgi:hypothetical protein
MKPMLPQTFYRIRAQYYTPMLKPLGVNVPGSPSSTMLGTAPLYVETMTDNPLAALGNEITEASLEQLSVRALREIIEGIRALSDEPISKSGKKEELIQRILTSPQKDLAVQRFLVDKDVQAHQKQERILLKLFNSLRGGLRAAGVAILRDLNLPYSLQGLPDDKLPDGAHRPGECPDSDDPCLLCQVFGSLNQASLFQNYTPPLVDDADHKLIVPHELNHVFIRMHPRNVHRPDGSTLNFNQQYFAGVFTTYLQFPNGLPDPLALGFLLNCLERCTDVGAAKAWGSGKLVLQSYSLEKVTLTYTREWNGNVYQLAPTVTISPLKTELDQALDTYTQWLADQSTKIREVAEGMVEV